MLMKFKNVMKFKNFIYFLEKRFLFHVKSSSRSSDIYIFVLTFTMVSF